MTAQPTRDRDGFWWLDQIDYAVERHAYDCTCQVGGVDAMSIDTDWLRHAARTIRHEHRAMAERAELAEHRIARLEAQTDVRGRAVAIYRERAREAEARIRHLEDTAQVLVKEVLDAENARDESRRGKVEAEARIKAVEDVLDTVEDGHSTDPVIRGLFPRMVGTALIRRALDGA